MFSGDYLSRLSLCAIRLSYWNKPLPYQLVCNHGNHLVGPSVFAVLHPCFQKLVALPRLLTILCKMETKVQPKENLLKTEYSLPWWYYLFLQFRPFGKLKGDLARLVVLVVDIIVSFVLAGIFFHKNNHPGSSGHGMGALVYSVWVFWSCLHCDHCCLLH